MGMGEHKPTPGPNLATLAGALMRAGWTVRFTGEGPRWAFEARCGAARLEVPRGVQGRHATVVQRLADDGTTEWGMIMTPETPESVILATATAAAQ